MYVPHLLTSRKKPTSLILSLILSCTIPSVAGLVLLSHACAREAPPHAPRPSPHRPATSTFFSPQQQQHKQHQPNQQSPRVVYLYCSRRRGWDDLPRAESGLEPTRHTEAHHRYALRGRERGKDELDYGVVWWMDALMEIFLHAFCTITTCVRALSFSPSLLSPPLSLASLFPFFSHTRLPTHIVDVEFQRSNKTVFVGTTLVGFVGVLNAIHPSGYSTSIDAREKGGKVLVGYRCYILIF